MKLFSSLILRLVHCIGKRVKRLSYLQRAPQAEVKSEAQWYSKPPMSPELLIAIAVRNLDPHKEVV